MFRLPRLPSRLLLTCFVVLATTATADEGEKNASRCYAGYPGFAPPTSGYEVDVVMANDGVVHLAYHDAGTGILTHMRREGGIWTSQDLVFGDVDDIALEVGADRVPTVAWIDGASGTVKWVDAEASLPTIETVNPSGPAAREIRMDSDATGNIALVFHSTVDGQLYFAERPAGGPWSAPVGLGAADGCGDIAFAAAGNPVVAYATGTSLRYARRSSGSWIHETVRSGQAGLRSRPGLCRDNAFVMQIAWARGTTDPEVVCSYRTGSGWVDEVVGALTGTDDPRLEICDEPWGDDITITHHMEQVSRFRLFNRFSADVWDERTLGDGLPGGVLEGAMSRHTQTGAMMAFRTGEGVPLYSQEVPCTISGSFIPNPAVGGERVGVRYTVSCADRVEFDGQFLSGGTLWRGTHYMTVAPGDHVLTAKNGFFTANTTINLEVVAFGTVSFTASPPVVAMGDPVTLSFAVEGADTVTIAPIGYSLDAGTGSTQDTPLTDTTYTLWAENTGYGTLERTVAVDVELFSAFSFSADGGTLVRGETSTLRWNATGADTVRIEPGGHVFTGPSGQLGVAPNDTTVYTMTAVNSGFGQRSAEVTVPVIPLRIAALAADPAVAVLGEPVEITWSVFGQANVEISGEGPQSQSGSLTVYPAGDTNYVLTAEWEGFVEQDSVFVQVVPYLMLTPSFSDTEIDRTPPDIQAGTSFDVWIHWTGPARRFNGLEFLVDLPEAGVFIANSQALVSNATNFGTSTAWQIYGACATSRTNLPVCRLTLLPTDTAALEGRWLRVAGIPGGVFPDNPGFVNCSSVPVDLVAGPALPLDPAASAAETPTAGRTAIGGIHPNPFNPQAQIRFELAGRGGARVAVYDLAGRRVRTLDIGAPTAGAHAVTWDGRDDTGREAPSGVYLVRLEEGGVTATARATLVR